MLGLLVPSGPRTSPGLELVGPISTSPCDEGKLMWSYLSARRLSVISCQTPDLKMMQDLEMFWEE